MRKSIVLIFIAAFIVSSGAFAAAKPAQAVLPVIDGFLGAIDKIFHAVSLPLQGSTAVSTGVGAAANVSKIIIDGNTLTITAFDSALNTAYQTCDAANKLSFAESLVDNFGNALASVGDQTKTASTFFVGKKLVALQLEYTCYETLDTVVNAPGVTTSDNAAWQALQAGRARVLARKNAVDVLKADYQKQQKAGFQDIFKAFSVSLVLNLNKTLTTRVVNDLKSKLKIDKYWNYAEALTNEVYAVDYIKKNYSGDPRQQLILTSLLKARNVPGPLANNSYYQRAASLAERQATQSRPTAATLANWNNNQWYQSVSRMAEPEKFSDANMKAAQQQLDAVLASAHATAALEIQNGQGFKGTRSCVNRTADQKRVDSITNKAVQDQKVAQQTLDKLREIGTADALKQLANPGVAPDYPDIDQQVAKAEAGLDQTSRNLDAVPQQVNGGILDLCSVLESPGKFLADQINSLISQQLQQTSDLKAENMPLYAKIISKFTSNFVTGILFGKAGSQVLKETGDSLLDAAGNAVGQSVYDSTAQQAGTLGNNMITFSRVANASKPNTFTITWDASSVHGAGKANVYRNTTLWQSAVALKGHADDSICDVTDYRVVGLDASTGTEIPGGEDNITIPRGELLDCGSSGSSNAVKISALSYQAISNNFVKININIPASAQFTTWSLYIYKLGDTSSPSPVMQGRERQSSYNFAPDINEPTAVYQVLLSLFDAGGKNNAYDSTEYTNVPIGLAPTGGRVAGASISLFQPRGPAVEGGR